MKYNINYYFFILPIVSLIYCVYYSLYFYDGYHFGLVFSNAIDLNDGKTPYKEIFIEYGYLTTFIHAFILKIFGNEVFYLQLYTGLIYSISITLIGFIVKKFTNVYYGLFSIICLFLIYPIPLKPWPIYNSYFFYTLALFFFIKEKNKYKILSGFFFSFAYLSFTTVYNYVIIFLILFLYLYYFIFLKEKNKIKDFKLFLIGLFLPLFLFFLFLLKNDIFDNWLTYQKLPVLFQLAITEKNIIGQILFFLNEISVGAIKNFIVAPHQIYFGLIFYIVCFFILKNIFLKVTNKYKYNNNNLIIVSIFVLSITPHAQIGGIEKMSTSLSLGIIVLLTLIYQIKAVEYKYFIFSFLIFNVLLIVNNNYRYPEYSSFIIDTKGKIYNPSKINYFNKQKWDPNEWNVINGIIENSKNIKNKCNINTSVNLTGDSFFYSLLENKIQLIPFFFKSHGNLMRDIIEPNLISNIQKKINNNKIFLIASENNNKFFELKNYSILKEYNIDKRKSLKLKIVYIFVPNECFNKINS